MTCITCHNPHRELTGVEADRRYVAVCVGCHSMAHVSAKPAVRQGMRNSENNKSNCLTCHMWKRRTDGAVHVVMTDHYIQRFKPSGDLLAPLKEVVLSHRGEVVPYYPSSLSLRSQMAISTSLWRKPKMRPTLARELCRWSERLIVTDPAIRSSILQSGLPTP
jgi:hypothetical protein